MSPTDSDRGGPIARVRRLGAYLKENRERLFWWWIAYQAVKGALTLSLIWIPLAIVWWRGQSGG